MDITDYTIILNKEQQQFLTELAKILDAPPDIIVSQVVTSFLIQSEPLVHLERLVNASKDILPAFYKATQMVKEPLLNLTKPTADRLNSLFATGQVGENIQDLRNFCEALANSADGDETTVEVPENVAEDILSQFYNEVKKEKGENDEDS